MASTGSGVQLQTCPGCGQVVETTGLEPFAKSLVRNAAPSCGSNEFSRVSPWSSRSAAAGWAPVYKARDARLNRFVALKLLRKEFAGDASFTAKLKDEARITASIKHPHVIEVFSVGEDHGQFYVVMELVDGGSLDDQMEDEKRISELKTLEVGIQVAKGSGGRSPRRPRSSRHQARQHPFRGSPHGQDRGLRPRAFCGEHAPRPTARFGHALLRRAGAPNGSRKIFAAILRLGARSFTPSPAGPPLPMKLNPRPS